MKSIWKWIEHNRFTVILPTVAVLMWIAVGCAEVTVTSPLDSQRQLTGPQLQRAYDSTVAAFEDASMELEAQLEQRGKLDKILMAVASGSVSTWPGLLQVVLGGGILGLAADNTRKSGVIGGLKKKIG